jgi:hypothetical protein
MMTHSSQSKKQFQSLDDQLAATQAADHQAVFVARNKMKLTDE